MSPFAAFDAKVTRKLESGGSHRGRRTRELGTRELEGGPKDRREEWWMIQGLKGRSSEAQRLRGRNEWLHIRRTTRWRSGEDIRGQRIEGGSKCEDLRSRRRGWERTEGERAENRARKGGRQRIQGGRSGG